MVKAVVQDGVIIPNDPLPDAWTNGTEVEVEKPAAHQTGGDDLDRWFAELEALASQGDPEDDRRLAQALREVRRQEKELARKQLELPE